MAARVIGGVLTLPHRDCPWAAVYPCRMPGRIGVVAVHVGDFHEDRVAALGIGSAGQRPVADHDRAIPERELDAMLSDAKPLKESEGTA